MDLILSLLSNIPFIHKTFKRIYYKCFGIRSIIDKGLKVYVKKAEKELKDKEYEKCAINIARAFDLFIKKVRLNYKKASGNEYEISHSIVPFDTLISMKVIDLDILEYRKFKSWLPNILYFESGKTEVNSHRIYNTYDTQENLKFCLKFLIKVIINNQKKL